MPLDNFVFAVQLAHVAAGTETHRLRPEAHRAAFGRGLIALLRATRLILPLGDQRDDGIGGRTVEFRAVSRVETEHVAPVFNDRQLHAEADTEIGDAVLARVAHGLNLALGAALTEAAGNQNGIHAVQAMQALSFELSRFNVMNIDASPGLQPAVHQSLVERDIGIANLHVLADHRDIDLTVRIGLGIDHVAPFGQVGWRHFQAQLVDDDIVEPFSVQQHRDLVDIVRVNGRDNRAFLDVGEQRDFAPLFIRQRMFAAAQQNVRLNTDAAQLLDRMLRWLGLDFAATDHRHQCQMHVDAIIAPELDAQLPDRLQKRQRFNVADRAADFDHADIGIAST